jgi:hypothetical protein
MFKSKTSTGLFAGVMAVVGMVAGTAFMVSAQTAPTTTAVINPSSSSSQAVDKPESANDPADTDTGTPEVHKHAPLGGDGVVASITGSTIVVAEESDEGGASYTVDASKATVTNKSGVRASLSDIKVGDKVFVQGVVNGTNVAATSISLGHPEKGGHDGANDADGSAGKEAGEGTSTSNATDQ